jgi:hypothetical protein
LQFTVWFGALRDTSDSGVKIPVFKSWATPGLDAASCEHTFLTLTHRILLPTTTFMTRRQEVLRHQGQQGVWFAGGWTNWFDSQEAALDSATTIAESLPGAARAATPGRAAVPVDRAHDADAVNRWLARIAAIAPPEVNRKLRTLKQKVDTDG